MEYKSNFERYKATGFLQIDSFKKPEMWKILEDELIEQPDKLSQLRKLVGLNQQEIAEILSVTQSSVSQWEKGTKKPSAEILLQLADLYEIDIKEFLTAFGFTFRH